MSVSYENFPYEDYAYEDFFVYWAILPSKGFEKLGGRKAITAFQKWFFATLDDRMAKFRERVRSSAGYEEWENDFSSSSLKMLSSWCYDRAIDYVVMEAGEPSLSMSARDVSVNVGIYLSLVLIRERGDIDWHFNKTARKSADYGQPTIGPFAHGMYYNIVVMVEVCMLRMARGAYDREGLLYVYERLISKDPA